MRLKNGHIKTLVRISIINELLVDGLAIGAKTFAHGNLTTLFASLLYPAINFL